MSLSLFILNSCAINSQKNTSFYEKIKKDNNIFKDFLKHEGLVEVLKTMDSELYDTNELIIITQSNEYRLALFIYDKTNDKYFFAEKYFGQQNYSYEKLTELNEMGETILFVLKSILDNKIENLKKISEEAYNVSLGRYQAIHILDILNHKYVFCRYKSFDVYKGKPVMTEEEFWESVGIKNNE